MTTDDPCDDLDPMRARILWGQVMLDRTTDPIKRQYIKFAMNQHYGRAFRPIPADTDPFDTWTLARHDQARS